MRKGAELAQTLPPEWVERLNQALFSSPEDAKLLEDPVILAACRRANRAELLHWANANLQRPGEPVQPYVSADMVDTARELARRGLSEPADECREVDTEHRLGALDEDGLQPDAGSQGA